jgi:hypothetical protein
MQADAQARQPCYRRNRGAAPARGPAIAMPMPDRTTPLAAIVPVVTTCITGNAARYTAYPGASLNVPSRNELAWHITTSASG